MKAISPALAQLETQFKNAKHPPVDSWTPALSGDMDLVICRNGTWLHEGDPILRPKLVQLFASILRREDDEYFLLTPVEKWRIEVELAPFVIQSLSVQESTGGDALVFETNVGDKVILSDEHSLWVESQEGRDEPIPLLHIRSGLNALLNRNVFYELVEMAQEEQGELFIYSLGKAFSLGKL